MLRAKHRNEVLVAKLRLRAVRLHVMLECFAALDVHVARIPFVVERRNGKHAPVNEDSELGIAKPFRHAVRAQRIPVRLERTRGRLLNTSELLLDCIRRRRLSANAGSSQPEQCKRNDHNRGAPITPAPSPPLPILIRSNHRHNVAITCLVKRDRLYRPRKNSKLRGVSFVVPPGTGCRGPQVSILRPGRVTSISADLTGRRQRSPSGFGAVIR